MTQRQLHHQGPSPHSSMGVATKGGKSGAHCPACRLHNRKECDSDLNLSPAALPVTPPGSWSDPRASGRPSTSESLCTYAQQVSETLGFYC